ncbi:MAG: sensor histidine kinase [Desulfococcaceae bacterium]
MTGPLAGLAALAAAAMGAAAWRLCRRLRAREAALRRSRRALEAEVERRTAELERTVRELDDFAHVVAHDLREPLRGIYNLAAFLESDLADRIDPESRDMLETLGRMARRMDEQVRVIRRFARIGQDGMRIVPTDIDEVLDAVEESLGVLLAEGGGEIRRVRKLPVVPCDPVLTQDLFRNLIANGLKYNQSPAPRVEIDVSPGGECPVFRVRDNGIGIPPDRQEEIFTIFRRLHGPSEFGGGSGAGLAIARKIVRCHGGWLWLESTPGNGTTFFFTLEGYCGSGEESSADFDY